MKFFMCALLILLFLGCSSANVKKSDLMSSPDAEKRIAAAKLKRGEYYAKRLEIFINESKNVKTGGVVFIGDSITEGFPLDKAFPNDNVINRGISGDKIDGVTERLDVSAKILKPKKIYLKIGINDLCSSEFPDLEKLAKSYKILLMELKNAAPGAEINVLSILPVRDGFASKKPIVNKFNKTIKTLAEEQKMNYIDMHPAFEDEEGYLRSDFTGDGIHLTPEGYLAWLEVILTPDKFFEAAGNMSPLWADKHALKHKINKIDPKETSPYPGGRGAEELVIYTPAYGKPKTGTNEWGSEAVVINDVVVKQNKQNTEIPANGYVVSGHNQTGIWISSNLQPGVRVNRTMEEISVKMPPESEMTPKQRFGYLRANFFETLAKIKEKGNKQEYVDEAKLIFADIQEISKSGKMADKGKLNSISDRIKSLNERIQ